MGQTLKTPLPITVVKTGEYLTATASKPLIISADSFNIPAANLTALAATVGGIPISDRVPVQFHLVLKANTEPKDTGK
ncbi:hypothetical protein KUV89_04795 [Marinobacter hydrocarbonoclasticus]|nr:hypothetical protein [Marinobacter nauticus]